MELEKLILKQAKESVAVGIKTALEGYNSPLNKLVVSVVSENEKYLKEIVSSVFTKIINSEGFKDSVNTAFKHKLAKILVSKLEGSVEKAVTTLRSDPVIRAKMVLAIENIINESDTIAGCH